MILGLMSAVPGDAYPSASDVGGRDVPAGLEVKLSAPRPVVPVGEPVVWRLSETNATGRPLPRLDVIDVLPFRGDGRTPPTSFHGTRRLVGPVPPHPGDVITYTRADARALSADPGDGTGAPRPRRRSETRWCFPHEFKRPGCPRAYAEATAFRIVSGRPLPSRATLTHTVTLSTPGARGRDVYTDRFAARAAELSLRVRSSDVAVRLQARPPKLQVVKTADRASVRQGGRVRYKVVISNVGQVAVPNAAFSDDLARELTGARYGKDAKATAGTVAYSRPELKWQGSLAPGASVTVTYTVTAMKNGKPGKLLDYVTAPYSNCQRWPVEDRCKVTVYKLPRGRVKDQHH
ncbi:DUF11 domain-containing protein [Actinomadura rupiterrae]|uniref:DUF11 domain-containing protein n=1 Tax=Actinomadura rupiterrae TaxID=559627 RepID=UPI0020A4E4E1|nr:DUF11 domain-containing protein [Actinomadura rupiterrae]MCP2339381.1 putative repeat protein (TIGR01451 family) [Actinomadura rupiterrae]